MTKDEYLTAAHHAQEAFVRTTERLRQRRQLASELRAWHVQRALESGATCREVARALGITHQAVNDLLIVDRRRKRAERTERTKRAGERVGR